MCGIVESRITLKNMNTSNQPALTAQGALRKTLYAPPRQKLKVVALTAEASYKKGMAAEATFEKMVRELMATGKLPWALDIHRATYHEDHYEMTDFKIDARSPIGDRVKTFQMKVQVKSSVDGLDKFYKRCLTLRPNRMIHVVVVNRSHSIEETCFRLDTFFLKEIHARIRRFPKL